MHSAIDLPQPDPQDRLRVLQSAASVVSPFDRLLAQRIAREGARLEAELITSGQTPVVSILSAGQVDCATATQFVESVPANSVDRAEDSLVSAITLCKQAQEPARLKLQAALDRGVVSARPLLALMEISGPSSRWSQAQFTKMFASLPANGIKQAPDFAAMFERMAPAVDKDVARDAGLKFLDWLAKQEAAGERNLAVSITTDTLRRVLGREGYDEALRSDIVAQSVAQTEGRPGEIERPQEEGDENVSALEAMGNTGKDRTDAITAMAPPRRAREAAAHGFASGTAGDRRAADHYFDIAFSALDEVWSHREKFASAPAIVEEVSDAAAHVDPVAALVRAQGLSDPSARAIGMLAVARVVVGQQDAGK